MKKPIILKRPEGWCCISAAPIGHEKEWKQMITAFPASTPKEAYKLWKDDVEINPFSLSNKVDPRRIMAHEVRELETHRQYAWIDSLPQRNSI